LPSPSLTIRPISSKEEISGFIYTFGNSSAGPGSIEFGLARLGAAGPERAQLSGAGHTRRRHGTNDIGKATNARQQRRGRKDKKAKLETTRADNTVVQRKEDNISGNSGTGGSSDDSSNAMAIDASSAGRDKEIGGGGKEGVLT
jgi:hypothetical protein